MKARNFRSLTQVDRLSPYRGRILTLTGLHMYLQSVLAKPANILCHQKTCIVEACCDIYRLMWVYSQSTYLRGILKLVMLHRFIPLVPAANADISYHRQICSAETHNIHGLIRVYKLLLSLQKISTPNIQPKQICTDLLNTRDI